MHSKVLACVGVPVVAVLLVGCRSCVKGNGEQPSPVERKAASVGEEASPVEEEPTLEFMSQHYGENQEGADPKPLKSSDSEDLVRDAAWTIGKHNLTKKWLQHRPVIKEEEVVFDFLKVRYQVRSGVQVIDASSEEFEPAEAGTPNEYPLPLSWDKEKVFKRKRGESVILVEAHIREQSLWESYTGYTEDGTEPTLEKWKKECRSALEDALEENPLKLIHNTTYTSLSDELYPGETGGKNYFAAGIKELDPALVSRSAMQSNEPVYYHMADGTIVIASKNKVYYRVYKVIVIATPPEILRPLNRSSEGG